MAHPIPQEELIRLVRNRQDQVWELLGQTQLMLSALRGLVSKDALLSESEDWWKTADRIDKVSRILLTLTQIVRGIRAAISEDEKATTKTIAESGGLSWEEIVSRLSEEESSPGK